jgi:hypothetical protein
MSSLAQTVPDLVSVTDRRVRGGDIRGEDRSYRVVDADGTVRHYLHESGPLHRAGGPAVENLATGRREWWLNGDRHRVGGPAVERPGRIEYWLCNLLHRDDGPAVITATGEFWYRLGYPFEPSGPSHPPTAEEPAS